MSTPTRILTLRLKAGWWHQIRERTKLEEFRPASPRYIRQLLDREYDEIHLWLGYPPKTDLSKRMRFAWRGAQRITRQHHFWGPDPVDVISIDLTAPLEIPLSSSPSLLLS